MSIYQTNINALVAALYHKGLRYAVISPGSRNAPLIMAFVRFGKIKCISVADERSAAFVALGIAKQLQESVAVICTSGSAVLNLYPAIAEAFYMQVPLLAVTADRPSAMLDRWDGQTIHQNGVFKPHVLASYTLPEQLEHNLIAEISSVSKAAYGKSNGQLKGPVHINVPLKEPLYAAAKEQFIYPEIKEEKTEPDERKAWEFLLSEAHFMKDIQKVLVIHGAASPIPYQKPLPDQGRHPFAVVLSDPISNRLSSANIRNWEGVLLNADEGQQQQLIPDLLITTGKMILNKSVKTIFRKYSPVRHWHIDKSGYCADTFFTDPVIIDLDPEEFFAKFSTFLPLRPSEYFKLWHSFSERKAAMETSVITSQYNAFSAVKQLLQHLPENIVLHLANSMSVRYAAYLNADLQNSWEVYSNRGVSGIDGCTSTAVGAAMADSRTHVLITGDVAFFYDINALWQNTFPQNLKIALMNDSGGGIFKNIDGPAGLPELDPFLQTPHHMDAKRMAEHFGLDYFVAKNEKELEGKLTLWMTSPKAGILEIPTEAETNSKIFNQYKAQKI